MKDEQVMYKRLLDKYIAIFIKFLTSIPVLSYVGVHPSPQGYLTHLLVPTPEYLLFLGKMLVIVSIDIYY